MSILLGRTRWRIAGALNHFRPVRPAPGVWAAYYSDGSSVVVFATEIDALRHAVDTSMAVVFWPFGLALYEAEKLAREARP